jgi:hypothetical protein
VVAGASILVLLDRYAGGFLFSITIENASVFVLDERCSPCRRTTDTDIIVIEFITNVSDALAPPARY